MADNKCIICNTQSSRVVSNRVKYGRLQPVVQCCRCGLVYLAPSPSEETLVDYYNGPYLAEYMDYFGSHTALLQWWEYQGNYILQRTRGRLRADAKILEVGCAGGGILNVFKKAGYSVDGLDLSKHWIQFAKETFDLDVLYGSADVLLSLEKKYDLIILSHVAEHWIDPLAHFCELQRLLLPNGILYVETPNIRDVNWGLGLENYFCLAHTFYFSPVTLRWILMQAGLFPYDADIGRQAIRYFLVQDEKMTASLASIPMLCERFRTQAYLAYYRAHHRGLGEIPRVAKDKI